MPHHKTLTLTTELQVRRRRSSSARDGGRTRDQGLSSATLGQQQTAPAGLKIKIYDPFRFRTVKEVLSQKREMIEMIELELRYSSLTS